MDHLFKHLHMPTELAIEFMATFSRMEYALKSTGTYMLGDNKKVQADWDKFANHIDSRFNQLNTPELIASQKYLWSKPPKKQVIKNNKLDFDDLTIDKSQKTTQQLLIFVRTVRNNLFHGGKFLDSGEAEQGRNKQLVASSLTIIKACIALDTNVKQSYEN